MENILTKVENNVFYINTSVKILESKEISMKNRIRICKVKAKLNDGSNIPATFSIENAGFNHYEIKLIPSNIKKHFELHFLSPQQSYGVLQKCSSAQSYTV
ncbi:MAG: hypothetical protein ACI8TE_000845 [Francisella sp.]|jgi:hypothetical protein